MSEDDEITLDALSTMTSVRKGVQVHPNVVFNGFKSVLISHKSLLWVKNGLLNFHYQPIQVKWVVNIGEKTVYIFDDYAPGTYFKACPKKTRPSFMLLLPLLKSSLNSYVGCHE